MTAGDRVRVRLAQRSVRLGRVLEADGEMITIRLADGLVVTVNAERVELIAVSS